MTINNGIKNGNVIKDWFYPENRKEDKNMNTPRPLPPKRRTAPKEYITMNFDQVLEIIDKKCGSPSVSERYGKGEDKVLILAEAKDELDAMISFGRRSPMNMKEQKYLGYGHIMRSHSGAYIFIVKHFIQIHTKNRARMAASNLGPNGEYNPGLDFLEYYREELIQYEFQYNTDSYGFEVDPFLNICGHSQYIVEGHTHPDLSAFFSNTDMVSGRGRMASGPVCIFVCDPVRKEIVASVRKDFLNAEVIVFEKNKAVKNVRRNKDSVITGNTEVEIDPIEKLVCYASECLSRLGINGKMKSYGIGKKKLVIKLQDERKSK